MRKAPVVLTPLHARIGLLVHYYVDGWRYGYLDSIKGAVAKIRPIGVYRSEPPRLFHILVGDIEDHL